MDMSQEFKKQYLNEVNEEHTHVVAFKNQTEKEVWRLGDIKIRRPLTKEETYLYDMCKADLKRAKNWLRGNS